MSNERPDNPASGRARRPLICWACGLLLGLLASCQEVSEDATCGTPCGACEPVASTAEGAAPEEVPDAPASQPSTESAPDASPTAESADSAGPGMPQEKPASSEETSEDEELAEEVELAVEKKPWELRGRVSVSLRSRARGSQQDEDLYGYLSLDGGDAREHDLTFHAFARLTFDLDNDEDRSSVFSSLNDVRGRRLDNHLYEAYVDLQNGLAPESAGIRRIRIGRQRINAGISYLVDGARVDFGPFEDAGKLEVAVFGGALEFLYETDRRNDWLVGTDIRVKPMEGTQAILRYVHASDRNDWRMARTLDEDYLSLRVIQKIAREARGRFEWNTFDGRTRDLRARVDWADSDLDLTASFDYRWQNDIQREFSTPHDPLVVILGDSFSHSFLNLQASKLFGDKFSVEGGFAARLLHDGDREGPFNRDYTKGWISLSSHGWPHDTLSLSLSGEFWEADDESTWAAALDVSWRPTANFRLSVGEEYARYRSDLFAVAEREDARVFYARMKWKFLEDFQFNARYEYETGDAGDFHAGLLGLTWTF